MAMFRWDWGVAVGARVWYARAMIRKVVKRYELGAADARRQDRDYWLSRPAAERVAAVDFLRSQVHGTGQSLQRVVRIVDLTDLDN